MDNLPKGLGSTWEYKHPFKKVPFEIGQVWRKAAPMQAIRIKNVMLQGRKEYDGAAQGLSVVYTNHKKGRVYWERKSWFMLGDKKHLYNFLKKSGYAPVNT